MQGMQWGQFMRKTISITESTFNPVVASLAMASLLGACHNASATGQYEAEKVAGIGSTVQVSGVKFIGSVPTGMGRADAWVPRVEHFQQLALDLSKAQEDLPVEMRLASADYLDYLD